MAMISFVRRHSETHLADYFEITLAEWKHCCILYEENHMGKKCYNQFSSDKMGLIYCTFLWMSLQCLVGIFFQCTFSLRGSSTSKVISSYRLFFKLSIFLFVSIEKQSKTKQKTEWSYRLCDYIPFQHPNYWVTKFSIWTLCGLVRRQFMKVILCWDLKCTCGFYKIK